MLSVLDVDEARAEEASKKDVLFGGSNEASLMKLGYVYWCFHMRPKDNLLWTEDGIDDEEHNCR